MSDKTLIGWTDALGGKSHTTVVKNPDSALRIIRFVDSVVSDVIDDVMNEMDQLLCDNDATAEEITQALSAWSDFSDAWEEHREAMS